jgi:hypothetical protein
MPVTVTSCVRDAVIESALLDCPDVAALLAYDSLAVPKPSWIPETVTSLTADSAMEPDVP